MSFNAAAVKDLFARLTSHAQTLGIFDRVNQHEPENPPGSGASYSLVLSGIAPVTSSGLASTSGRIEFTGDIYSHLRSRQLDQVDPDVLLLASDLIAAYSGDLDLGGTVRDIDLLGHAGAPLSARAAYLDFQGTPFRIMRLTVPVIVNDLWVQA